MPRRWASSRHRGASVPAPASAGHRPAEPLRSLGVPPRFGGQHLDALGQQHCRFTLHLHAVLQILDPLSHSANCTLNSDKGFRGSNGPCISGIALPGQRISNIELGRSHQNLRLLGPFGSDGFLVLGATDLIRRSRTARAAPLSRLLGSLEDFLQLLMRRLGRQPLSDACRTLARRGCRENTTRQRISGCTSGTLAGPGVVSGASDICCGKKSGDMESTDTASRPIAGKRNKGVAHAAMHGCQNRYFHRDLVYPNPSQRTARVSSARAADGWGGTTCAAPKTTDPGQLARCQVVTQWRLHGPMPAPGWHPPTPGYWPKAAPPFQEAAGLWPPRSGCAAWPCPSGGTHPGSAGTHPCRRPARIQALSGAHSARRFCPARPAGAARLPALTFRIQACHPCHGHFECRPGKRPAPTFVQLCVPACPVRCCLVRTERPQFCTAAQGIREQREGAETAFR